MTNDINRCIQLDNWIFEVKMVRALRVEHFGKPYSAIANLNLNGSSAYIDGLMNKNQEELSIQDLETFKQFCQLMGVEQVKTETMKNFDLNEYSNSNNAVEEDTSTRQSA